MIGEAGVDFGVAALEVVVVGSSATQAFGDFSSAICGEKNIFQRLKPELLHCCGAVRLKPCTYYKALGFRRTLAL